jgi:hypothetical protein
MIHTYNLVFHSNLSSRRFLKINNYFIWDAIKTIIKKLDLTLTLTKVKAHSGLPLNDKADELAAKGRVSSHYININHKALSVPLTFNWDPLNTNIPIDRNIRQALKVPISHKSFYTFLSHKPLKEIATNSFNKQINWQYTKL